MKVYVLEQGAYDTRTVVGVFTSIHDAKAAAKVNPSRWKTQDDGSLWNRSTDYTDIAWIKSFDLDGPHHKEDTAA